MSFEEKVTWVNVVVTALVVAAYASIVGGQLGNTPAGEIAYEWPMIISVGAMVGLTILGTIGIAIGTAISAEVTGTGSVDEIDRKDERDIHIGWRGDRIGYYVCSMGLVGVLALTMLEYEHFWIANAIFASCVVAGLAGSVVKLVAYRRGF